MSISRHKADLCLGRRVPDRRDQNRRRFGVSIQHRLEFGTGWNQPVVENVTYAPLEPEIQWNTVFF